MFLRNSTSLEVRLARGHLFDEIAVAAVVVTSAFRASNGALVRLHEKLPARESDPPDISGFTLWEGVSVTVAGTAAGPRNPPYVRPVVLRVGAAERRLIVFGERRWQRGLGGDLEPSAPASFERIELSFKRAFGGGYDVPPGLLPGTDLPHPGFRMNYLLNGAGVGSYPNQNAAHGAALPNVERPDQLIRRWNDTPEPAGFSPCPDLVAWRAQREHALISRRSVDTQGPMELLREALPSLRTLHYAPPSLIFDDVPVGARVALEGLGLGPMNFAVPVSPIRVSVRTRREEVELKPRLRALHVDADVGVVRMVHDHPVRYDSNRPPSWVRVIDQGATS